ncbi:MAG: hypothetical protein JST92_20525, partial [Deltaproteobacteria bacterium]|nr:hypothetical protein [Deltaproteobacteria bacterium]
AWSVHPVTGGRMVVTRPFEVTHGEQLARRDAVWLVKLGDPLLLKPESAEAREITLRHNRCDKSAAGLE